MKHTLIMVALIAGMDGTAAASTSFDVTLPVSPQSTFFLQSANDVCSEYNIPGCNMDPIFISLISLGVQTGDTITIRGEGGLCFYANQGCTVYLPDLGAVFSSSNILLAPSFLNRLPGAVAPGADAILIGNNPNLRTFAGNLDTAIPDAFYLPAMIVVPAGGNYLVVAVLDSAYADNSSNFLAVEVTSVAEPNTYTMILSAISGLWLLRRRPSHTGH